MAITGTSAANKHPAHPLRAELHQHEQSKHPCPRRSILRLPHALPVQQEHPLLPLLPQPFLDPSETQQEAHRRVAQRHDLPLLLLLLPPHRKRDLQHAKRRLVQTIASNDPTASKGMDL